MTVDIPLKTYKIARGDDVIIPCQFTPQPVSADVQISWTATPDVPGDQTVMKN